jgi:shikimate dehydrogenase
MLTNNKTRLNLVIGYPLEHSQSPLLHSLAYQELDINAVLLALPCAELVPIIQVIKTLCVGYFAVTMPHKEKILEYLDECSPEVQMLGAVNTVLNRDGKLIGYNSDVDGIAYALRNTPLANKLVLVLGAGGAARAAAYVLANNAANIYWLNRTAQHAEQLVKVFGGQVLNSNEIKDVNFDVIINTTPLGMYPNFNQSPLNDYSFNAKQTIFDMIYNPLETHLLKQAKSQGATCISGIEMFVAQGLRQIELWLDKNFIIPKFNEKIQKRLIQLQQQTMRSKK